MRMQIIIAGAAATIVFGSAAALIMPAQAAPIALGMISIAAVLMHCMPWSLCRSI
jgi:hypothetical protein